jgi:hypothetical protein
MRIHDRLNGTVIAVILASMMVVWSPDTHSQEGKQVLRAGIARVDITPNLPVAMGGYGARKGMSEGVHDNIFARAIAFESGGKRLVMVSYDLVGLNDAYEYLQKTVLDEFGLKPEELVMAWTHTHSGPNPGLNKERAPVNNISYTESLRPKTIQIVREALDHLTPVHTGVGVGSSPVGASRRLLKPDGSTRLGGASLDRNPYGPADKEVLVLKITKPDGSPVAALFDYATHNTSMGARNMQISGDVLGCAQQFVEKILGPGALAPVFVGAAGDINPWYAMLPTFNTEPGWIPETTLLGTLLGEEVVHVYRNIKETYPGGEIRTAITTIQVPGKKPQSLEIGKDPQLTTSITISAARVGNAVFVAIPAGFGTELGMAIKTVSRYKNTFIITECNNKVGYIPPEYQYNQGGYEVFSSNCGPQAADMVIKAALQLIYGL